MTHTDCACPARARFFVLFALLLTLPALVACAGKGRWEQTAVEDVTLGLRARLRIYNDTAKTLTVTVANLRNANVLRLTIPPTEVRDALVESKVDVECSVYERGRPETPLHRSIRPFEQGRTYALHLGRVTGDRTWDPAGTPEVTRPTGVARY